MIIDLDRWLAEESAAEPGGRLFPHDLFISHRRFNLPTALIQALRELGVAVVWDCDLDLRDRRVMSGVSRAMRRSRHIALYVSLDYVDSPWCRAEYLNALWVEEKFRFQRAIVICESDEAIVRVPESLLSKARFVVEGGGIQHLAAFAKGGNLIANSPKAERTIRLIPSERLAQSVDELTPDEQLSLLEQRLSFWAEGGIEKISLSQKERQSRDLAAVLGDAITEPEIIFRESQKILLDTVGGRRREGIDAKELVRVISMAKCILTCYSNQPMNSELRAFDRHVYDLLLKPLLLAVEMNTTRFEAAQAYRALCSAVESGACSHEVSMYRRVLEAVESGLQDVRTAVANHRVAMYDAASSKRA